MPIELKRLLIGLATVLIIAPLAGWGMLRFVEKYEKDWKSGNRRKRWVIMCSVFIFIAIIGGWLR